MEVVAGSMGTNGAKGTTVAGGVKSFSSVSGTAIFESLRLVGKPDSGPYRLVFFADTQVTETSIFRTSRHVDRLLPDQRDDWQLPPRTPAGRHECGKRDWKLPVDCNIDEYLSDTDTNKYKHSCVGCPPAALVRTILPNEHTRTLFGWWKIPEDETRDGADGVREMFAKYLYAPACGRKRTLEGICGGKQDLALKDSPFNATCAVGQLQLASLPCVCLQIHALFRSALFALRNIRLSDAVHCGHIRFHWRFCRNVCAQTTGRAAGPQIAFFDGRI